MAHELDLDDELIWESYTGGEEVPVEDIEDYLTDPDYSDEDIADEFEVDPSVVRKIRNDMYDKEKRSSIQDDYLLNRMGLKKDQAKFKSTEINKDIPSDKINPDEGSEWYANMNTTGVPDVKSVKKRGKKIGKFEKRKEIE